MISDALAAPVRWGNLAVQGLQQKLAEFRLSAFRPKVSLSLELNGFRVKTAGSAAELREALALRHEVFFVEELGAAQPEGLDFDSYDPIADHILVQDKSSGETVATYRLISSSFSGSFYSQSEFHIDGFLRVPGVKLELGRACVHRDFRDGKALAAVWRGVGAYAARCRADALFGCSTLWGEDPLIALGMLGSLAPDRVADAFGVAPRSAYRFDYSLRGALPRDLSPYRAFVPPLLAAYLRAGARLHGLPAWDRKFRCMDFFTVLDLRAMHPRMAARFFPAAEGS